MKIVYEQGDIVFNNNNNRYGIVIADFCNDSVKIIEMYTTVYINNPPRGALTYKGHCDFEKELFDIIESGVKDR